MATEPPDLHSKVSVTALPVIMQLDFQGLDSHGMLTQLVKNLNFGKTRCPIHSCDLYLKKRVDTLTPEVVRVPAYAFGPFIVRLLVPSEL